MDVSATYAAVAASTSWRFAFE
jgi:hypothetical protein